MLEERDVRAICELKYRYLRTLDSKDWDGFEQCFLPEATGDYNGLVFDDRAALVSYMRENLREGLITLHQAHHPEIEVDGDTAAGRWYLYDRVIVEAFPFMLEGGAFYSDRYVRTPEGWRVAHTGYRRTFEATYNLGDLPGFKLSGPGVHTHKLALTGRASRTTVAGSLHAICTTSTPRSRVISRPRPAVAGAARRLPIRGPSSGCRTASGRASRGRAATG